MTTLQPGYYLSTYLAPPMLANLLRITPRHDQNLTLWHLHTDGSLDLVRHWELERLSGEKHHWQVFPDAGTAQAYIEVLLRREGVAWQDLVSVWGTPELDAGSPYRSPDPRFPLHAIAHLMPALLPSTDELATSDVLAFAVDGGPDHMLGRTTFQYAGAVSRRGKIDYFPAESPGRLFNSSSHLFGLEAGSLMALASATETVVDVDPAALLGRARFDRSIPGTPNDVVAVADEIVGRIHAEAREQLRSLEDDDDFSAAERVASATIKVVQDLAMRIMARNVERALDEFGLDPHETTLGMSGGFALNCPTNAALLSHYGFRSFSAPPCPNDSGQAIGLGLAMFHAALGPRLRYHFPGPFLGPALDDLDAALARFAGQVVSVDHSVARFVDDVVAGPVAWVEGRSEVGPRALGHRSLLCDPRSLKAREQVNEIKRRQWWRPVAPIVSAAHMDDWFEDAGPSPYMLRTFRAKPGWRHHIPAVVHLDGTARCQTVDPDTTPALHDLLARFHAACGMALLGNSSLNDRGEPIVQSATEALDFCLRRGVRVCYLDGHRVVLNNHHAGARGDRPARSWCWEPLGMPPPAADGNPHGLSGAELYFLATHPALQVQVDFRTAGGAARVRHAANRHYTARPHDLAWVRGFLARKQAEIQ